MSDSEYEEPPIRFTDNRKINRDGTTGGDVPPVAPSAPQPPEGADAASVAGAGADDEAGVGPAVDAALDENAVLLDERTRDLQRLSAEYANYRKRAERERLAAGELAVGRALVELLPVVDDLDRAREHGDLTGALKAVADKLDAAFTKLGLEAVGVEGDEFDPQLHEAVMHDEADDVSRPTVTKVLRKGYRHQERLLRAAMVGVTDPSTPAAQPVDAPEESQP